MGLNGRRAGKRIDWPGVTPAGPPARSSHPAVGYLDFGRANVGPEGEMKPLDPEGTKVGSAGLGRQYQRLPEVAPIQPGEVTLRYGGGYVDAQAPLSNGFVDRAKLVDGLHYIWTDEFVRMPISARPFWVNALTPDSLYGVYRHFKKREAMNGAWWRVLKALPANTGFVAQTRPDPQGGPVPNRGVGQNLKWGTHQTRFGLPDYTFEVPRPTTRPRTVVPISVMPS